MYDRFGAVAGGEESDVLWLDGREDKREVGYEWVMDSRVVIFFLMKRQHKSEQKVVRVHHLVAGGEKTRTKLTTNGNMPVPRRRR